MFFCIMVNNLLKSLRVWDHNDIFLFLFSDNYYVDNDTSLNSADKVYYISKLIDLAHIWHKGSMSKLSRILVPYILNR